MTLMMELLELHVPSISLDPVQIIVGGIAVPLLYFAARRIRLFAQTHVGHWLDATFWRIGKSLNQALATRASAKSYARTQLSKPDTRYLRVPGREPVTLETDSVYVPLSLETGLQLDDLTTRADAIGIGRRLAFVGFKSEYRLTGDHRIRVIGDPGAGKSSFVKHVFRECCSYLGVGLGRLPILIELRHFRPPADVPDEDLGDWAFRALRASVAGVEGFEMGSLFDTYVADTGVLVLLDGLDEVASDMYARTAKAIQLLSAALGDKSAANVVVLTMRVQFHDQVGADFDDQFPILYRVAPFTPGDIYEFLARWPFKGKRQDQVRRIYSDLTDRPTLREMCRNPLVLAMYVASDQRSEGVVVPDTRTSFYDQVVEELLVARRSRQLGITARKTLREQREALLGRLAFENLTDPAQPANSISWSRAVELATTELRCDSREQGEARLLDLSNVTGIVSIEREGESFRFIHLTFCEFLAAKEAAQGRHGGWAELLEHWMRFTNEGEPQVRSRLSEVVPFGIGLLARADRESAVADVQLAEDDQVLARCLLETQAYDGPVFEGYVEREAAALVATPGDSWNDRWLERLHLLSVVLQDAEGWATLVGRGASARLDELFRELVRADARRLAVVFGTYAASDAPAAYRLAAACGVDIVTEQPDVVVRSCATPAFLDLALEQIDVDSGRRDEWVQLLAEAAFRHGNIGVALDQMAASGVLADAMLMIDPRRRWSVPLGSPYLETGMGGFRRRQRTEVSAFDAVLTLALASRPAFDHLAFVDGLRGLPAIDVRAGARMAKVTTGVAAAGVLAWLAYRAGTAHSLGDLTVTIGFAALGLALARGAWSLPEVRNDLYVLAVWGPYASYRSQMLVRPSIRHVMWLYRPRYLVARVVYRPQLRVAERRIAQVSAIGTEPIERVSRASD